MSPPTVPQDPRRELEMLLASRFALIVIESREEARVLALVRESSLKARRGRGWGVFQWTVTEGLQRIDVDMGAPQRMLAEPPQLLRHLKATPMPGIYVLLDFHPVSVRSHQRADVEGRRPGIRAGGTDHRPHEPRGHAARGARELCHAHAPRASHGQRAADDCEARGPGMVESQSGTPGGHRAGSADQTR